MSKLKVLEAENGVVFINQIVEVRKCIKKGYFSARLIGDSKFIEVKGDFQTFLNLHCESLKA